MKCLFSWDGVSDLHCYTTSQSSEVPHLNLIPEKKWTYSWGNMQTDQTWSNISIKYINCVC